MTPDEEDRIRRTEEIHYYYPHCKNFGICASYNEASRMLMCSEDGYKNPDECPIYIRVVKYKKCDEMFKIRRMKK